MQRRKKRKLRKTIISLFFIVVLVISLFYFTEDISEYIKVKKEYKDIKNKVIKEGKTIDWEYLWSINRDIVAWIEIPNTPVDYPVVQTKNNSEYLYKNIRGSYSIYGTIFLDERLYETKLGENPNNIIYGHNMGRWAIDAMFGSLSKYLNREYFRGHEEVNLYTPDGNYHYVIASVMLANPSSSVYNIDLKKKQLKHWIKEQINKSIYECLNIDYATNKKGGELRNNLTLSTCDTIHNDKNKVVLFCISK